jgi:phosphohistidine swiveling domain-containing protein
MKPKYLNDNDPWMLGEHIPNCDLFFSTIWLNGFVSYFDKHLGRAYKKILCKYEGYNLWFYFGEHDSYEVGEYIADKIINNPGFAEEINKNIIVEADKLRMFSETIPQKNLENLSDKGLWEIYQKHHEVHSQYYTWGWIPVAVDMFHGNLTRRVKEYLRGIGVADETLNEYLVLLTQPTKKSLIAVEQEDLVRIALVIEEAGLSMLFRSTNLKEITAHFPKHIMDLLEAHRKKYYYTKHIWVEGEYTVEDYLGQLEEIFSIDESVSAVIEKQAKEFDEIKRKRESLMRDLAIDAAWKRILDAYGDFMVTKIYRRYAQLLAVHHMSAVLKEIAKRKYITEKQVRFATFEDIKKMLLEDVYDEAELLRRTRMCIYYAERGFEKVFVEEEAREIAQTLERDVDKNISELTGESGCIGYAKGKVKVIIRASDMEKMKEGDVLVSIATDPDIVPAMKKASAIITEQGGVTSHAAIVSRELGIPCVIGTKIATKVLKDGDMVEVDANRGIVKKL